MYVLTVCVNTLLNDCMGYVESGSVWELIWFVPQSTTKYLSTKVVSNQCYSFCVKFPLWVKLQSLLLTKKCPPPDWKLVQQLLLEV